MSTARFGLIPLNVSNKNIATTNEFLINPTDGHIYIKQKDGSLVSKTVELEERLEKIEMRQKYTESYITLNGKFLLDSIIVPSGVSKSLMNGDVKLSCTRNGVYGFKINKEYFNMAYTNSDTYMLAMDVYGDCTELTVSNQLDQICESVMFGQMKKSGLVTSVVFKTDKHSVNTDMYIYFKLNMVSTEYVLVKNLTLFKINNTLLNAIDLGGNLHIDAKDSVGSDILESRNLSVSNYRGTNSQKDTKVFNLITTSGGMIDKCLNIYLDSNLLTSGRYSLQIICKDNTATGLYVEIYHPSLPTKKFKVNTTAYTKIVDSIVINLAFDWDVPINLTTRPYLKIYTEKNQTAKIESVHIQRSYAGAYSDNSRWQIR